MTNTGIFGAPQRNIQSKLGRSWTNGPQILEYEEDVDSSDETWWKIFVYP